MTGRTAGAAHEPDRDPTDEEEEAADASTEKLRESGVEETVAEHYEEMARRGVEQEGEGRID